MPNNRLYTKIIPNAYYDSVTLMRCSTQIQTISGIGKVALMMGTPANQVLMVEQDLWNAHDNSAGPTDLCVSMTYESDEALALAMKALEDFMAGQEVHNTSRQAGSGSGLLAAHSWKEAAFLLEDPKIAAISVPGAWAAAEARQALEEGFHVFLYSDNVPLDEELALKQYARDRELIVMGPDCGTVLIGGAPLGFINRLSRGSVGIIAASGTGAQEVSTALDRAGVGVSSIIGIGSHDMTAQIGGISFQTALAWFRDDDRTEEVAIVAKPPDTGVLNQLRPVLEQYPKPLTALFLGRDAAVHGGPLKTVNTIGALISAVSHSAMETPPVLPRVEPTRYLRGLFVGGTLAIQASVMLDIPVANEGLTPWTAPQHVLVDLGDDRFTVGRPHPMIDGSGRGEALKEVLMDPRTGIVVGDIVLGDGAESDPVVHILQAIKEAATQRSSLPPIVFTVVGTRLDPQNYDSQVARLQDAGVWVTQTSTAAIQAIQQALGGQSHE